MELIFVKHDPKSTIGFFGSKLYVQFFDAKNRCEKLNYSQVLKFQTWSLISPKIHFTTMDPIRTFLSIVLDIFERLTRIRLFSEPNPLFEIRCFGQREFSQHCFFRFSLFSETSLFWESTFLYFKDFENQIATFDTFGVFFGFETRAKYCITLEI